MRPVAGKRAGPAKSSSSRAKAGGGAPTEKSAPARERVLRLFFGLQVPEAVAAELVAAQSKLTSNWRRVEAGQLHVTLAYVPGVPEQQVPKLRELGQRLAAESGPLSLRLRGTGYHPNVGSPRVWFVKVEGEGLQGLAARFAAELDALGFPAEAKFQPHVTLARKKGAAPRLPPLQFAGAWDAQQVHLIHTFLPRDKTGPIYDTVSRFTLSGNGPLPAPQAETSHARKHSRTETTPEQHPEEHHGKVQ
jgi:RNA 2',3'-cyclic 3'-phosphodiesterase